MAGRDARKLMVNDDILMLACGAYGCSRSNGTGEFISAAGYRTA